MSPLARSLLALAAILAVSTAQYTTPPPPNCSIKNSGDSGQRDIVLPDVDVPCPNGPLPPFDHPCEMRDTGMFTCGVSYEACNPNPFGPAPIIDDSVICTDPDEVVAVLSTIVHCCYI